MPPTPRRGSITLMIFAAIAAAGAGVFWIIRGIVGLSGLSSTWGYYDEPAAQRYAAAQDMNLGIAKGFDCASDIAEIIVGILLFTGITFLLLRKRSGSTWISVGGLLGLLPLILFVFRDIYWSAPLFPPAGAIAAFIIGVVALVFALLPAVRSTARPPTPYDPPSARPW